MKIVKKKKLSKSLSRKGIVIEVDHKQSDNDVDHLDQVIIYLQQCGHFAPTPEFIPEFAEMVKLMNFGLEMTKRNMPKLF